MRSERPTTDAAVTVEPAVPTDLEEIRTLLREYAAWIRVDLAYQGFEHELRDLPGEYVPPRGGLLIARLNGRAAGMVAFRPAGDRRTEMKRLFVRSSARGRGIGQRLVRRVIEAARISGARAMILDTLPVMGEAQRLYVAFGFTDIPPYYDSPVAGTRYMALDL